MEQPAALRFSRGSGDSKSRYTSKYRGLYRRERFASLMAGSQRRPNVTHLPRVSPLEPAPERDEDVVGFGKIYPAPAPKADESEEEEEEDDMPLDFISRRELEKWRLTKEEMRKLSVFKNYDPGDPNCRLYVKNLSKQVDEKDLKFIFGRFVNFSSETEKIMFDIRLMKEGRMKGQAFVGFPSEDVAAKALKQANGYVLHDKPMVIQFARSARPKPNAKDTQKKR
ncbi:hypothetical protein FKM82_017746 [Ascaphus truei]